MSDIGAEESGSRGGAESGSQRVKRTAKSFPVYLDYARAVEKLSDKDAGKLFKALLAYARTGQEQELDGKLYAVFAIMQNQMDRDAVKYEQKCQRQWENGIKGGRPPRTTKPNGSLENPKKPMGFFENPKKPKKPDTDTDTDTVTDTDTDTLSESKSTRPPAEKHAYGEFGWVKLTDAEYCRLGDDLGEEERNRCITYVDESAQSTGNRNQWRDWNLVVRRCHRQGWGLDSAGGNGRRQVPMGASGQLGQAELEAIQQVLSAASAGPTANA